MGRKKHPTRNTNGAYVGPEREYNRCKYCGSLAWTNSGRVCMACEEELSADVKEAVRRAKEAGVIK